MGYCPRRVAILLRNNVRIWYSETLMKPLGYRKAITDYIRVNAKPREKFSHQPRLYKLAVQLAEERFFEDDVLFAAAWLHDLGVFVGHRPENSSALSKWDNVGYALRKAPALLKRFGFPMQKVPAVLEAIRTHQPSAKPTTFEGTLLRDADILEQLGAIAILRTVCKIGRDTRFTVFEDAIGLLRKNLESLPKQLRLESARRRAKPRVKVLKLFLDGALAESNGFLA